MENNTFTQYDELDYNTKKYCLLGKGTYEGYDFYIKQVNYHPCCYIRLPLEPDNPFACAGYWNDKIEAHWGVNYAKDWLDGTEDKGFFIGWSYDHCGDYRSPGILLAAYGYIPEDIEPGDPLSLEDLIFECHKTIHQIIDLDEDID